MSSVFYRSPAHDYPVAVRGEGVYLDGRIGAAVDPSAKIKSHTCFGCGFFYG